ncbi:uncharacterized protein [Maniola hyperantus]|uniref:uncharacterized protein n=1 Tax=Aphantopus hyperantus TaxID=2795564 RepID=UPI00212AD593
MYKYSILFVAAIFSCVQCLPLDASHSESAPIVGNNSTQSTNYHPSPVMSELEYIEQEIDDTIQDLILPYLSLFFDSLLGHTKPADDESDCDNDMPSELVPDETAMPPQPSDKADKKSQPEEKSGPNPDTANIEGKSEVKSDDNPDVVPTPEKPVDNVQTKP